MITEFTVISAAIAFFVGGALGCVAMTIFCANGVVRLQEENIRLEGRIARALDKLTPKSAHIGRQMAAILRGDE